MAFFKGEIRLVIIDDDIDLSLLLKEAFEAQDYTVAVFNDAPQCLHHIRQHGLPHLALVDLRLPSQHGFQLSQELKEWGDVPIIFISSDDDVKTVVHGITNYADDYITKPFDTEILIARVKRLLNRVYGFDDQKVTRIDDHLTLDLSNNRVYLDDRTIVLTPIETRLLSILIRNMGDVVPAETLISHGWPRQMVLDETLRVHMYRLRHKLEPEGGSNYIQTVRGVGYCFMAE